MSGVQAASIAEGLGIRVLITPVAISVESVRVVRRESIGSTDSWRSFCDAGNALSRSCCVLVL